MPTPARRWLGAIVSLLLAAGVSAVLDDNAEAAVVRPFTLNYNQQVYGDFLQLGNGNSVCPGLTAPTDPFGEPKATCLTAQARTYTAAGGINDSYYMQWGDVDADAATFNSSTATITVPPGARVDFARLNWSGDTGTIRLADGTVSVAPGCNTRQFLAGAGTAVLPSGTPESTSVRLTVGSGATTAVAPAVISRDALANVPNSQPQFYAAYATVTAQLQAAATGTATTITVGNVWTPQGFGCYSGWSLVVVYAFDEPDPVYAPGKREVFLYDGHVRQSSVDPTTTVNVTGFRVASTPVRVGLTGYEGDFNISGDQFSINGTPQTDPLGSSTTNFWVSDAENEVLPSAPNNMSVDAKEFDGAAIPVGATSAQLSFSTAGDTYLAQNLVLSVPVPSVSITKDVVGGPFRPGQSIPFVITVVSPGGTQAVNVLVDDPLFADCDRDLGTLLADVPVVYTCTGPAPADDGVNTADVTAEDPFGDPITDSAEAEFEVVNPAVDITKTADEASYSPGDTVTFTITVTNTGDTALTAVTVVDPKVPACDSVTPLMAIGASTTYTCTTVAPVADDENTATVTALDPLLGVVTDSATAPAPTLGSVAGRVFADRNDNGVFDAGDGDTAIGGVTVTLTGGTLPVTVLTAIDGTYTFADLPAGTYTVTETQPAAFDDGQDTPGNAAVGAGDDAFTVTLAQGTQSTGNNFAELPTSSLAGTVYEDLDGDGLLDVGEPGIGSVTVALAGTDSAGNSVTLTTTTSPDGTYSFPALRDGIYAITETQPVGYLDGTDAAGSAGGLPVGPDSVMTIPLAPRTDGTGYLFGETVAASISGSVVDDDGDGIGGVTVTLTGGPLLVPVVVLTAPDGTYSFTELLPGTYTVTETQPVGYGDGDDSVGSAGGDDSVSDVFSGIVLGSGVEATEYEFAETRGSLAGSVYDDRNGSGLRELTETGISGVTVTLTGTDATGAPVSLTTTTAVDGSYLFDDLLSGTYTVTETQPAGYLDGTDAAGTSGGTPTPTDTIAAITLAPGVDATGYLFGESVAASISGTVEDDDGDGIGGVTVTLTGGPLLAPIVVLTAPDGTYSFTELLPGVYTVTETQPTGYGDGDDTVGSAGGTNSANDVISAITITSGTTATGYDFAETRSSLAGSVYADDDNDGLRDLGETGIGGVTVTLTGTDDTGAPVVRTTTTAGDGTYSFDDLLSGTYAVTETQPSGYLDGTDAAGTSGGLTALGDSIVEIILDPGTDATGYLFGELAPASIAGAVTDDGGNPIAGVTITLTGTDDLGAPVLLTTTTTADGTYTFEVLRPGTYTVTETQPTGYGDGDDTVGSAGGTNPTNDVLAGITITPGTTATGYDFAETRSSLAGSVYADDDNDGLRDLGENGIGGVTVTLTGLDATGAPVVRTTTTAVDGTYAFDDLLAGTYTVTETQPTGYLDGTDAAGTSGGAATPGDSIVEIILEPGTDATGYLFGELVASSLSGTVTDDGGNPIAGVTITLTGTDDLGAPVLLTTTTTAEGTYTFEDLRPGTYAVTETQPTGYGDGDDTVGSAGGTNPTNDVLAAITLVPGTTATGYDFAETRSSLAGSVYKDGDNDGARDVGEAGIGGVTVTLTGLDDTGAPVNLTTTTAVDGTYSFDDLLSGTYTVTETQPSGYLDGTDAAGTSGGAATPGDSIVEIILDPGTDATGYLFGELLAASLSGFVVDDSDAPIPGVVITLTGTDDLGAPVALTTTTNGDGVWSFEGLRPGTYSVTETQPAGYGDGPETVGSAGGENPENDLIIGITLTPGLEATGYVFAEDLGSLTGSVYEDRNGDGARDLGEAGIGGVTVTLTGTDALGRSVSRTTTTAGDGGYTFDELVGGVYTLVETQPVAYADGIDTVGTAGGSLVDPDTVADLELGGGVDAMGYLFGELAGTLTGVVYLDEDGDGAIDLGETVRLPGVVVILLDDEGVEITRTTTDEDGRYAFPGLPAGDYSVQQEQPEGYGSTTPNLVDVTMPAGGADTVDFGERLGAIGDRVWSDTNGNGVQDLGEPGVADVVVVLWSGDDEVDSTTTDSDGAYAFTDLMPGTYTVSIELPDGLALVAPGVGDDGAVDSDLDRVTLTSDPVVVEIVDGLISQVDDIDAGLVDAVVDLTVTLVTDRPTATVGDVVTFTSTVDNDGTVPVPGATTTITVPAGLRIDSVNGSGWTCSVSGQVATCATDRMLLPDTSTPPITVVTTALTALASTTAVAQVYPPAGVVEDDLTNNGATAPVAVNPVPQPRPPLPATGIRLVGSVLGGLLLLVVGMVAVLATTRRRQEG